MTARYQRQRAEFRNSRGDGRRPPPVARRRWLLPVLEHRVELRVLGIEWNRAPVDEQILRICLRLENVACRDDDVRHFAGLQRTKAVGDAEDLRRPESHRL